MFAVPGWNLASKAPLVGKEKTKAGAEPAQPSTVAPTIGKRKRIDETENAVSSEDLGKLWNKHFGQNTNGSIESKKKRKDKQDKKQKKPRGEDGKIDGATTGAKSTAPSTNGLGPSKLDRKASGKADGVGHSADSRSEEPSATKHKKNKQKNDKDRRRSDGARKPQPVQEEDDDDSELPAPPPPAPPALTPLQQSMRAKLISARFRHLNETLYTVPSSKALSMFSESPELFAEYHAGFTQQVNDAWPENPVHIYTDTLKTRAKIPFKPGKEGRNIPGASGTLPLPRRPHGTCTVADLGCGDAKLARGLQSSLRSMSLKFHNFDLHAANSLITKADIANLPLKDGEVDIAVFCLSLMGTNWINFVEEAWRILRGDGRGEVWVAEVKSRFGRVGSQKKSAEDDSSKAKKKKKKVKGKTDQNGDVESDNEEVFAEVDNPSDSRKSQDDTDISSFVEVFQKRGFALRPESVNKTNKMFVSMIFTKTGVPTAGKFKGMKWVGTRYEKISFVNDGKKRFLTDSKDEVSLEAESKVLKPCVYKIR